MHFISSTWGGGKPRDWWSHFLADSSWSKVSLPKLNPFSFPLPLREPNYVSRTLLIFCVRVTFFVTILACSSERTRALKKKQDMKKRTKKQLSSHSVLGAVVAPFQQKWGQIWFFETDAPFLMPKNGVMCSLLSRLSFLCVSALMMKKWNLLRKTSCASGERLASLVFRLRRTLTPSALNTRASRSWLISHEPC